jgi:valyl-tRNA synthetase
MLNNTIQDVLIRRARLKGFNALLGSWYRPCFDLQKRKVVAKLKTEGINKNDLTRENS